MSPDLTTPVTLIQAMLAPAVMISACGLLLLGMQNKYGRIIDRLRELDRERHQLLAEAPAPYRDTRLRIIDHQVPLIVRRGQIQSRAVQILFYAVAIFVADTFLIGLSLPPQSGMMRVLALLIFLVGQALVLWAVLLGAREIGISFRAAQFEADETRRLRESELRSRSSTTP